MPAALRTRGSSRIVCSVVLRLARHRASLEGRTARASPLAPGRAADEAVGLLAPGPAALRGAREAERASGRRDPGAEQMDVLTLPAAARLRPGFAESATAQRHHAPSTSTPVSL
jgi:hypothetical protein